MRDFDEVRLDRNSEDPKFTLGDVVFFTRQPDDIILCMVTAIQRNEDSSHILGNCGSFMYKLSPVRFNSNGNIAGLEPVEYYSYEDWLEGADIRVPT